MTSLDDETDLKPILLLLLLLCPNFTEFLKTSSNVLILFK